MVRIKDDDFTICACLKVLLIAPPILQAERKREKKTLLILATTLTTFCLNCTRAAVGLSSDQFYVWSLHNIKAELSLDCEQGEEFFCYFESIRFKAAASVYKKGNKVIKTNKFFSNIVSFGQFILIS